jgi:hypothetical protein
MAELGNIRLESRLFKYRFLHCRARARSRYGLDLSQDDYTDLCIAFQTPSERIWRTDTGNLEGWVPVGQALVLAHYRPSERLVDTLLEPPPNTIDQDIYKLERDGQIRALMLESTRLRKELNDIRSYRVSEGNKSYSLGEYIVFLKSRLEGMSMASEIGSWYKSQINKALKYLKDGELDMSRALLVCLASSPASFDPTQDPKKASELLDLLAREKAEFWKNSSK